MFKDKLMVGKENKKLILGVLLTFIVCMGSAILALDYPNPGHPANEIGPGTFNCSGTGSNCYFRFTDDFGNTGLRINDGTTEIYKGLHVVTGYPLVVDSNTYLGNDSSDKTTVKGDLDVSRDTQLGDSSSDKVKAYQYCDETGANCHDASEGWPSGGGGCCSLLDTLNNNSDASGFTGTTTLGGDLDVSGTIIRTGYVVGDCNGDWIINFDDAIYLAKHVLGHEGYETLDGGGDINEDGVVDIKDATYLAKALLKWSGYTLPGDSIPYATYSGYVRGDCNGDRIVDTSDTIYLAKHVLGHEGYETLNGGGDINEDGAVNLDDATYLAKALLKWSGYTLPYESLPYAQYNKFETEISSIYVAEFIGGKGVKIEGDLNVSRNTTLGDSSSDKTTVKGDLSVTDGTLLVDNPSSPTLTGSYDTDSNIWDVYISGKYAYVADRSSGLKIIDISNPSSPNLTGSYDTSDYARGVYISGKYAYVADSSSGLKIIDISNPSSPTLTGSYDTDSKAKGVYISGKYAYVADRSSGLKIIDISNPSSPNLTGSYDTSGYAWGVYISGKYAYVADKSSGLKIIDISNPSSPTLTGSYDTSGYAWGVYISGKYAYVANWDSGLKIIDISNPSSPTLTGSYDTYGVAMGVYVSGKYAYVADYNSGLKIIDISNPSSPNLTGSYDTYGVAMGVYVSGKYAYVADTDSGLKIIDIKGGDIHALSAGNIETNDITVTENADVGNNLLVHNGLNVGPGGILSGGDLDVSGNTQLGDSSSDKTTVKGDLYVDSIRDSGAGSTNLEFGSLVTWSTADFTPKLTALNLRLGDPTHKWHDIWAVNTHFGDVGFANNFTITEAQDENALFFLNQKGEKIMKLDENGNLFVRGKIKENFNFDE